MFCARDQGCVFQLSTLKLCTFITHQCEGPRWLSCHIHAGFASLNKLQEVLANAAEGHVCKEGKSVHGRAEKGRGETGELRD